MGYFRYGRPRARHGLAPTQGKGVSLVGAPPVRARHGLAPTFEVPVILERRLEAAANLEHQAVLGLPAKLWAEAFAVKFEVDL